MTQRAVLFAAAAAVVAAQMPYVLETIAAIDCNGGVHLLPGHPLEINMNIRTFKKIADLSAQEIVRTANCSRAAW